MTFSGGAKARAALEAIAAKLKTGSVVNVGFLAGSNYPDGTSTPMVAAVQEFGSPTQNIPPRPFMRPTVAEHSSDWGPALGRVLKNNDYDTAAALALMGDGIQDQIQAAIKAVTDPPLAPATVAAKGFPKPLIDSGHMQNSVDYEVK